MHCYQSVRYHPRHNVVMGNLVLRQSTQSLRNLVTRALRVTVINASGDNLDRPGRLVVKAEKEVHEPELGRAGLHPGVGILGWDCLPTVLEDSSQGSACPAPGPRAFPWYRL